MILQGGNVSDLTPLKSLPLTLLDLNRNPVTDLSPLAGMKLDTIKLYHSQVRDLTPLKGMPLTFPGTTGVPAPMLGGVLARS